MTQVKDISWQKIESFRTTLEIYAYALLRDKPQSKSVVESALQQALKEVHSIDSNFLFSALKKRTKEEISKLPVASSRYNPVGDKIDRLVSISLDEHLNVKAHENQGILQNKINFEEQYISLIEKYLSNNLNTVDEQSFLTVLAEEENGKRLVEYLLNYSDIRPVSKNVSVKIAASILGATAFVTLLIFWASMADKYSEDVSISKLDPGISQIHGGRFKVGDKVRVDSWTNFEFIDGSRIKLDGELEVISKDLIFLKSGKVRMEVAPHDGKQLTLKTSDAEVQVTGTAFELEKSPHRTAVAVSDGEVRFLYDGKVKRVPKGLAAITTNGKILTSSLGINHLKYRIYNQALQNHESMRFYMPFDRQSPLSIFGEGMSTAELKRGRLVKGRTPFTQAIRNGVVDLKGSSIFELSTPFSCMAWIKLKDYIAYAPILTKGVRSWRFQLDVEGDKLHMGYGGSSSYINGVQSLSKNEWVHVAFVGDLSSVKLYVNGKLESRKKNPSYNLNESANIQIGGNADANFRKFKGLISEVALFERSLSDQEIESLYEKAKACGNNR
ncbi:MAG: FecR domain-containing protein [Lentisphaeraceae bacterium]|nr:FecR domain-containing protein [Lentisphaeraceae bacterium]